MSMDPPVPEAHPYELLADYVGGSLEAARREEVERHLVACAACREDVALSRRARAALASLPELDVPTGLTKPVAEGARHRHSRRPPPGGSPHRSSRVARVTWSVGAAAAAAVIAVFAWSAVRGGAPAEKAAAPSVGPSGSAVEGLQRSPHVTVTRQSIDYDAASIQALASRVAKRSPAFAPESVPAGASPSGAAQPAAPVPSQPSPATLGSAGAATTHLPPVVCLQRALGSSSTSGLVELIRATFDGKPAYIGVYATSGDTNLVTVWVVSTSDCRLLNYTSTKVP
jgi:hypothetical protein